MESLCRYFEVGRQAYYQYQYRASERRERDDVVVGLVKEFRKEQPRTGLKKLRIDINLELEKQGYQPIGRDWLFAVARKNALLLERRRSRAPITTYSGHKYAVQPNLIKERAPTAPGQVLVGDITYLMLRGGSHAYLFAVTDKYSRYIVGHHLASNLSHEGAIKAAEMAYTNLPLGAQPIHHTDRGVQYCCHEFLDKLRELGMSSSMTDADHCAQNALAERMNGILKSEFYLDVTFNTFAQAQRAVKNAICIYNTRRRHWSLGLRKPAEVHFKHQPIAA